jgi:hypothetical protein
MKRVFTAALFISIMLAVAPCAFSQSESRADTLRQIEVKRAELAALEKKFIAPSEEDRAMYADFLAQPDTGLIRLLPRETFDHDDKMTIRGGGAYYSFALLTHAYGHGSDIELQQNRLSVGFAGFDYGLLARAGNGPLDEVTFEHPSVRALAKYRAATTQSDARSEYQRFGAGASLDGIAIGSHLPVEVNANYVLRSINYSDSDVLVVLKVIGKDEDGSVTILWKLLKRFPKPEVARVSQSAN